MPDEIRLTKEEFWKRMLDREGEIQEAYDSHWKAFAAALDSGAERVEEPAQFYGRLASDYLTAVIDAVYAE